MIQDQPNYNAPARTPKTSRPPSEPVDPGARKRGIVKWFDEKKGCGFILHPGADVFIHRSEIAEPGYRTLAQNQPVEFDLFRDARGLHAKNLTKVEAYPSHPFIIHTFLPMTYLKFNDFGAYSKYLKDNVTIVDHHSHLDLVDLCTPTHYIFAVAATARVGDTILVCSEIVIQEAIDPPEEESIATKAEAVAWTRKQLKKIQTRMWELLAKREKAIKAEGIAISRGILMGQPPEILLRAK